MRFEKFALIPVLLIISLGVVDVATDIYIPTMPWLTHYFQTSEEAVALTVSCYLLSFCLSGPIYGPLSDAVGRRWVLIIGLGIFALFSFLCAVAQSIQWLIAFRFFQGLGGGVAWVLGLAIIKDIYKKEESVKIMATIGMVISLAPGAAPILGGYVGHYLGWQANFYLLGACALSVFGFLFFYLPETLPIFKRQRFNLRTARQNYVILGRSFPFLGYSLISALTFGGIWAYISTTPFFFMKVLGMSMDVYGYYQMLLLISYMLGIFLNKHLVKFFNINQRIGIGLFLSLGGASFLCVAALVFPVSPLILTCMVSFYSAGMGIVYPNTSTQAMEVFPEIGGASAAFLGALEMFFAALAVYVAGEVYVDTIFPPSLCVLSLALASCVVYFTLTSRPQK
ncbi:MAG: multidrug effflux MFS transporter [Alphaproteobacteria bacterium]